ncbi:MAG: DEAD/DEAH box helicase [Roseobacter sp.]
MIQTLSDALAEQGYNTLTPVQTAVSDPTLSEADLLVSAQTGSGKTVGFGLAIAPTLLSGAERFASAGAPLALVIAPTRELAMQVARELTWLYAKTGAVVTTCVGGMDSRTERRALERGAHIVVATPGRLCDHIKRENIDLSTLRAVVLDEADEMLDMGFREELEFILDEAPEDRRTLLFSATVPKAIAKMAENYQRDAQRITTVGETPQHADIEYRALNTHPRDVENAIINVLRFYEAKNAIVFCNTRAAVSRLTTRFTNRGFSVVALSGELTQSERTNALQALRDGRARVCVATDVAARGIDLPNLELVIHADLPTNADTLLHRSGRTGRAGRKGVSALIVPPKLKTKANRLLGWAKLKADWADPPSSEDVNAQDEARLLSDPAWTSPIPEDAQSFVSELTTRFSAEQLAQAFVNLYRARQSAPEELSDASVPEAPRGRSFGPSVWFSLSLGRDKGADPRMILPIMCKKGNLTRDDIGAIRVQDDQSYVEVLASSADALVATVGNGGELEQGITLNRLEKAPDLGRPAPKSRAPRKDSRPDKPRGAPAKPAKKRTSDHWSKTKPAPEANSAPPSKSSKPKSVWTKKARDVAKTDRKARDQENKGASSEAGRGKPASKSKSEPKKDNAASKKRASDTSKRFVPPHKRGQKNAKGPNAKPRRKPS